MRYKVFVLDSSRRVICVAKFDCIDEQAARRRAEQMSGEHDVEFWEIDRLIAVFRDATANEQSRRPLRPT